jgi:hypothetical protein
MSWGLPQIQILQKDCTSGRQVVWSYTGRTCDDNCSGSNLQSHAGQALPPWNLSNLAMPEMTVTDKKRSFCRYDCIRQHLVMILPPSTCSLSMDFRLNNHSGFSRGIFRRWLLRLSYGSYSPDGNVKACIAPRRKSVM